MMASHHGGSDGQRERMDGGGHGGGQGHMNGANSGGGIVSHAGVQRVHAGLAGMRIGQPAAHGQQQQPPRVPPMSSGVGPDAYGRGGGVYGGDHGRNSGYDMWSHGAVVNSAPGPPRSTASQHYMIASSMPSGIGGHSTSTASHAQSYVCLWRALTTIRMCQAWSLSPLPTIGTARPRCPRAALVLSGRTHASWPRAGNLPRHSLPPLRLFVPVFPRVPAPVAAGIRCLPTPTPATATRSTQRAW